MRPGLSYLPIRAASREQVDAIAASASYYGWGLLFADRHPYAGGPEHYAAYLEDAEELRGRNRRAGFDGLASGTVG